MTFELELDLSTELKSIEKYDSVKLYSHLWNSTKLFTKR